MMSFPINPDVVFADLEMRRADGILGKTITSSPVYYEASLSHPGLIDRVTAETGKREIGHFHNGKFMAQL